MSGNSAAQSGEERLIARYFKPLAKHPGAFGLADDAAALTPPAGCDLVLKTDGIVGGVHFFPDDPPDTVARKALRVNLSDLAAQGARPLGFLLTLGLHHSRADLRQMPRRSAARFWAAIPIAPQDRSPFRSRPSARSRMARCCAALAPKRVTASWSPAPSATRHSACCYGAMPPPLSAGSLTAGHAIGSRPVILCRNRGTL